MTARTTPTREALARVIRDNVVAKVDVDSVMRQVLWIEGADQAADACLAYLEAHPDPRIGELEAEVFKLAANQCEGPMHGDDGGGQYCPIVRVLESENARLRTALQWIADSEPATTEVTLAHTMAQDACVVLTNGDNSGQDKRKS